MNRYIKKYQKLKKVSRVFANHPEIFEGKSKSKIAADAFTGGTNRIGELISTLVQPLSNVYSPKQLSEQNLRKSLQTVSYFGMRIARSLHDTALFNLMKSYKSMSNRMSAYKTYENAIFVSNALSGHETLAIELGMEETALADFNTQATEFGNILLQTGYKLSDRKNARIELDSLLKVCNDLLKNELDSFAEILKANAPDFYREYTTLRKGQGSKKVNGAELPADSDISGTVTDSVTGLPIANATIDFLEHESAITTDADGYYLIDELETGPFTIGCHTLGYDVPQKVTDELAAGESLVIDFILVPVNQQN